jgi:hypothetical protein
LIYSYEILYLGDTLNISAEIPLSEPRRPKDQYQDFELEPEPDIDLNS